jgi:hypothetical protein
LLLSFSAYDSGQVKYQASIVNIYKIIKIYRFI